MGVAFGVWPPVGKDPSDQMSMRIIGSAKIGADGAVANDALGVVDSVGHSIVGEFLVSLKLGTLDNDVNVVAVLASASGEVDCSVSGHAATVHTRDSAGTLADRAFNLLILG